MRKLDPAMEMLQGSLPSSARSSSHNGIIPALTRPDSESCRSTTVV